MPDWKIIVAKKIKQSGKGNFRNATENPLNEENKTKT